MKKNQLQLSREQRAELERFSKTGTHSTRLITRAKIILLLDTSENRPDLKLEEIAHRLGVSFQTIQNVRRDYLHARDRSSFLTRKKRTTPPVAPKITGEIEARIIALACSEAPQGYAKWTLRLLAEKSVELQLVDSMSHMSIRSLLKKHNLSLT